MQWKLQKTSFMKFFRSVNCFEIFSLEVGISLLGDGFLTELHDNRCSLNSEEKSLAELGTLEVLVEEVRDLAVGLGGLGNVLNHLVVLGTVLVHATHHHFHGGDHSEELLDLGVNLGGLALEVEDLLITLKEEA